MIEQNTLISNQSVQLIVSHKKRLLVLRLKVLGLADNYRQNRELKKEKEKSCICQYVARNSQVN